MSERETHPIYLTKSPFQCSSSETNVDMISGKVRSIFPGSNKEIVIRDVCAKMMASLKIMPVIYAAVSFDPVHAALPWAGLRAVLQLCIDWFEGFGAVVEGLEVATALIARCNLVEALYLSHRKAGLEMSEAQKGLRIAVDKLHGVILKFLCQARAHLTAKGLKRLHGKEALEDSVVSMVKAEQGFQAQREQVHDEWLKNIGDGVGTMTAMLAAMDSRLDVLRPMQAGLDTMFTTLKRLEQGVSRGRSDFAKLSIALEDELREALLKSLSSVPVQEHYRAARKSMLPGTGRWLLTTPDFVDWQNSSTSEVYWLHGTPGCGKTNLATAVIKHLRRRNRSNPGLVVQLVAYFYCSREPTEPERSDAADILRSLVKHIALMGDDSYLISPIVADEYEKRTEQARRDGEAVTQLTSE
jgi:hypothetical protein